MKVRRPLRIRDIGMSNRNIKALVQAASDVGRALTTTPDFVLVRPDQPALGKYEGGKPTPTQPLQSLSKPTRPQR